EIVPLAAFAREPEAGAEQGLRGHRAQRHDDPGPHPRQLRGEPRAARGLFACVGPLVQARLAALLVLEVLDGIGQVDPAHIDAGVLYGTAYKPLGGTNDLCALEVLLRPGSRADKHYRSTAVALDEHGIRAEPPLRTGETSVCLAPQLGQTAGRDVVYWLVRRP